MRSLVVRQPRQVGPNQAALMSSAAAEDARVSLRMAPTKSARSCWHSTLPVCLPCLTKLARLRAAFSLP